MAAPMPGTDNYIEIIIENDYFRIKKLQIFLKSENLLVGIKIIYKYVNK